MLTTGFVVFVACSYLLLLFILAFCTDRLAAKGRAGLISSPFVYTLSLTVYCTSWTFYGAVGSAARNGLEFATIYLGPTLVFLGWWFLLRKLVRISKTHRITSIADFISSRYGKSARVAVVVTLIALIGTTPYIALQLKAVTTTLDALTMGGMDLEASSGIFGDTAFWIAAAMAAFVILFGTRNIGADEHHPGVVAAIAFESLVKLIALLAVGLFVVIGLDADSASGYGGPVWLDPAMRDTPPFTATEPSRWITMLILSAAAIFCLPRQFQVTVVEATDERHLRIAGWLFPLYLFLISLFTVPIAVTGLSIVAPGSNPDLFVLTVPMAAGQDGLALLAFIGGFSSATSMVIVACIALSIMISNHIVMPLLLRIPALRLDESSDLTGLLLATRRISIVLILTLGFLYHRLSAQADALAAIGLISFAGVAQFLPVILGGLYWRGGTNRGAVAGLLSGVTVWAYTLLAPSIERSGFLLSGLLENGPFGITLLRPEALFGMDGWDPLVHALFWSLTANTAAYVAVSLFSRQTPLESLQSSLFVDAFRRAADEEARIWNRSAATEDLMALMRRILGSGRAYRVLRDFSRSQGKSVHDLQADAGLISLVERELAGSIGAASARVMVSRVAGGETISLDEVITILDETQQAIEYSHKLEQKSAELEATAAELRRANAKLKQIDVMKDDFLSRVSHELRTPMTSIRSFSEVLLDAEDLSWEQKDRFLRIIFAESQRLTRLLDEILDLSRLERGEEVLRLQPIDPIGIAAEAAAAMNGLARQRRATLRERLDGVHCLVRGDADRLKQVFINLIHNAIKFNDKTNALVTIAARFEGGMIAIEVSDDGPGIAEEDRASIFDKFARRWDKAEGSGLGLAICKEIVEAHGGRIEVRSQLGLGASFHVLLPREELPDHAAAEPSPGRAALQVK